MVGLTILGSTGSIGVSTLDVVRQNHDRFRVFSLVAGRNVERLVSQIEEFLPKVVVVVDNAVRQQLADRLKEVSLDRKLWPELLAGAPARVAVSTAAEAGAVVSAIVGVTGLEATYEAIRAAK